MNNELLIKVFLLIVLIYLCFNNVLEKFQEQFEDENIERVAKMTISNNGNIGIGESKPKEKLVVKGNAILNSNSSDNYSSGIKFQNLGKAHWSIGNKGNNFVISDTSLDVNSTWGENTKDIATLSRNGLDISKSLRGENIYSNKNIEGEKLTASDKLCLGTTCIDEKGLKKLTGKDSLNIKFNQYGNYKVNLDLN